METRPHKNIVVYCSSRAETGQEAEQAAARLGQWIGTHSHTLVYGGVNAGLMHTVAENTRRAGGRVLGVCPEVFSHRADPLCHDVIFTSDLNARKGKMIEIGDIFVVLPGGLGTIDEWISTLSDMKVRQKRDPGYSKPIVVLNQDGMYNPLLEELRELGNSVWAQGSNIECSMIAANADQMMELLSTLLPSD